MASTTFFFPLKSLSLYVFPSVARSVKSGAGSPTFKCVLPGVGCCPIATPPSTTSNTRDINSLVCIYFGFLTGCGFCDLNSYAQPPHSSRRFRCDRRFTDKDAHKDQLR